MRQTDYCSIIIIIIIIIIVIIIISLLLLSSSSSLFWKIFSLRHKAKKHVIPLRTFSTKYFALIVVLRRYLTFSSRELKLSYMNFVVAVVVFFDIFSFINSGGFL